MAIERGRRYPCGLRDEVGRNPLDPDFAQQGPRHIEQPLACAMRPILHRRRRAFEICHQLHARVLAFEIR